MVLFKILAGGFASFIATYVFDSDAGTLTLTKQSETGTNPSWIASNSKDLSILYAVNELNPGGFLQSFKVDADGGLQNIDNVTTGGNGPTFAVQLSSGEVTAMNFGSPNCSFVATDPQNPLKFLRDSPAISFPVPAGGPSNPHMSLEVGNEILVPDLGADKIWRIGRNGKPGNFKVQGQINIDKGAGPRHIAVQDNILFTIHEKTSALTAQVIPAGPNGTTNPLIANVSIVPADALPGSQFAAAEIILSPVSKKFPNQLIYVSNRNISPNVTDPKGDTIAIFEFVKGTPGNNRRMVRRAGRFRPGGRVGWPGFPRPIIINGGNANGNKGGNNGANNTNNGANNNNADQPKAEDAEENVAGKLVLVAQIPTGLQQIRSMALGRVDDGGDEFLIAGANTVGGVAVFQRVDGGRNLKLVTRNDDLQNRTSFVFVE
ncbi:putative isomerase YbhE [Mycena indigotica]|uniref:Putative isomerase YbhE n=1 Tax=Mycena indigotica TaxID=2126181 RepID=A0A8H6VUP2_9AGAR|nr:putative isomerase YbhE [Mycena indigotica]KAF7294602.1 putative isomerase YbhE [Mycena indigotica]